MLMSAAPGQSELWTLAMTNKTLEVDKAELNKEEGTGTSRQVSESMITNTTTTSKAKTQQTIQTQTIENLSTQTTCKPPLTMVVRATIK